MENIIIKTIDIDFGDPKGSFHFIRLSNTIEENLSRDMEVHKTKSMKKETFRDLLKKIDTPEYKESIIKRSQKYLDDVSMDYQLGYYIGQYIISHYLPTLSTDMIKTRNVIQVNEEDSAENKRLEEEWVITWSNKSSGDNEKWNLFFNHNKMLENKYLPKILECDFGLFKFNNEKEFKEGIRFSLWDSDLCHYNIDEEKIEITTNMELGLTTIKLQYDK